MSKNQIEPFIYNAELERVGDGDTIDITIDIGGRKVALEDVERAYGALAQAKDIVSVVTPGRVILATGLVLLLLVSSFGVWYWMIPRDEIVIDTVYMQGGPGHVVLSQIHNHGSREVTDLQVELEFREQLLEMQMMQQQAAIDPMVQQRLQSMINQVEARKSILVAEMTEDFMKEEKQITSQFDGDPLLKLKSREVDLRAMENERKRDNDEAQQDLARARLMQQGEIAEDKMEQNEDLAKLRAGVSLAKTGVKQAAVITEDN